MIELKGSYILLIYNSEKFEKNIGKKLKFVFPVGFYSYIGSAMGESSTSIKHRLNRHVKSSFDKNQPHPFWHIDYFLATLSVELLTIYILPNRIKKEECHISDMLRSYCDDVFERFGCSDCKCPSHLFYFENINPILHKLL